MAEHKLVNLDGKEETEEEKRRKKRANQPIYDQLKAADEGVIPTADLLVEPSVDRHAALLRDAQFSGTANAEQIAQIVTELEQHYGNAYVQQVMAALRPHQPIKDAAVKSAMNEAWEDSEAGDYNKRHEEGGWIVKVGAGYEVERWNKGSRNVSNPTPKPDGTVSAFHTHPNPATDERGNSWVLSPSPEDMTWTAALNFSETSYVVGLTSVYTITPDGTAWANIGRRSAVLGG